MRTSQSLIVGLALIGTLPASSQVIVDHQPYPYGGSGSDLAFHDDFGMTRWQQSADEFRVSTSAEVAVLNWWAFYRQDNPPDDESSRVRLYEARVAGSLPGTILYEQIIDKPTRVATGRLISITGLPREFKFQASLAPAMHLDSGQSYWLEITQLDDISSWYVSEFSRTDTNGFAFLNDQLSDWLHTTATTSDLAFQLVVSEPVTAGMLLLGLVFAAGLRARGHLNSG